MPHGFLSDFFLSEVGHLWKLLTPDDVIITGCLDNKNRHCMQVGTETVMAKPASSMYVINSKIIEGMQNLQNRFKAKREKICHSMN